MFSLTDEQSAYVDMFNTGKSFIGQAGAGAGKTSVIAEFGRANPAKKIYYFAFNKAIVEAARAKLPSNMSAYTIHGYAYGRKGRYYALRLKTEVYMSNQATASYLGLTDLAVGEHRLTASKLASLVMQGCTKFAKTDSWAISGYHIPSVNGLMPEEMKYLRSELDLPIKLAWKDIEDPQGKLNFKHEYYVKLWAMDPRLSRIGADAVVIDEAQDTMASIIPVLERREKYNGQLVLIGDDYQSINEWNEAVKASKSFPDLPRLILSKSFRFGQEIADVANEWLEAMEADMRLTGTGTSYVGDVEYPDAILCRTNAGTIEAAIREIERGQSVAMLGDMSAFTSVADAALALQAGQPSDHYLFTAFETWPEVQAFARTPEGSEVKTWVDLIDSHGAQAIKNLISSLVTQDNADVICTTGHKTKGLEFNSVRVGNDFPDSDSRTRELTEADMMLAYVVVTRAKQKLQPGNLLSPEE